MPNIVASIRPGTSPAMKSWPTEAESTMAPSGPLGCMPLVATAKMTRLIDGGNRVPSAPDVAITPAANRGGEPLWAVGGGVREALAATGATDQAQMARSQGEGPG